MTRRLVAIVAIAAVLAGACSGSAGSVGPGGSGAASTQSGGGPAATPDTNGHRPSGAKVRIVNAYAPLNGDPGPIDVYAAPWVGAGSTPLITVPYGTTSAFFDPTVADDQGDMFLSLYWKGDTGNGNELVSQSETLKGGEVITYLVATADSVQDSGRRFGSIQGFFASSSGGTLDQPTPNPGKSLLIVDTVGLDNVLSSADTTTYFFGVGKGCAKALGDDESTMSSVGPGSAATYELDPGTYKGAIYSYPADSQNPATCSEKPIVPNIPITIAAGETALSFTFAPKDGGDLKTLVLALDK